MAVYVCDEHQLAFPAYNRLNFHWYAQHKEEIDQKPSKEESARDEVPMGYTLRAGKSGGGSARTQPPPSAPPAEEFVLDELPRDPPDLFHAILRLKGVPEATAGRLTREFKLSPWMWSDAQEIHSLLKGSKLGVSEDWIRSFLKQYGNTVELPAAGSGVAFVGGKTARDEFFGQFQPQVREDPQMVLLKYLLSRDERAEARRPDPAAEERLRAIETTHQQLLATQNDLLEMLKKQGEESEKALMEARFQRLEETITKQGKPAEEGGTWLKAFLDEREKRHQETLQEMTNRLATANELIAKAQDEARAARKDALAEDEERREKWRRDAEAAGYHPREKTTEERVLDIAENQALPAALGELKELRRAVQTAVGAGTGGGPRPAVSGEEAARMAETLEIEEALRVQGR